MADERFTKMVAMHVMWRLAVQHEVAARNALYDHTKAIEAEEVANCGYTEGQEIDDHKGGKYRIRRIGFNHTNTELVAQCFRTLRSGKWSKSADTVVVLKDYKAAGYFGEE